MRTVTDRQDLKDVLSNCESPIRELHAVIVKYKSLGSSRERDWDRLRFGVKNLGDIRAKLTQHTASITAYLEAVGLGALARIENDLKTIPERIQRTVDLLAEEIRAGRREGSIMTTYDDDEKDVWKQFRRELIAEGMHSSFVHKYKPHIRRYLRGLAESGELEERALHEVVVATENETVLGDLGIPSKEPPADDLPPHKAVCERQARLGHEVLDSNEPLHTNSFNRQALLDNEEAHDDQGCEDQTIQTPISHTDDDESTAFAIVTWGTQILPQESESRTPGPIESVVKPLSQSGPRDPSVKPVIKQAYIEDYDSDESAGDNRLEDDYGAVKKEPDQGKVRLWKQSQVHAVDGNGDPRQFVEAVCANSGDDELSDGARHQKHAQISPEQWYSQCPKSKESSKSETDYEASRSDNGPYEKDVDASNTFHSEPSLDASIHFNGNGLDLTPLTATTIPQFQNGLLPGVSSPRVAEWGPMLGQGVLPKWDVCARNDATIEEMNSAGEESRSLGVRPPSPPLRPGYIIPYGEILWHSGQPVRTPLGKALLRSRKRSLY